VIRFNINNLYDGLRLALRFDMRIYRRWWATGSIPMKLTAWTIGWRPSCLATK
jgi:hypothetical protein